MTTQVLAGGQILAGDFGFIAMSKVEGAVKGNVAVIVYMESGNEIKLSSEDGAILLDYLYGELGVLA